MRHLRFAALLIAASSPARAQNAPVVIKGHYVGESIEQLLQIEPEALQEVHVCKAHPTQSTCERLLAALDRGERAEISTSSGIDFVLDRGKVVKLTILLNETAADASALLTQKLDTVPSDKPLPSKNASGAKWENHLFVWSTPDVYVSLYQDNNPSLQNPRPLLAAETQMEHAREDAERAKQTRELESNNAKQ